MYLPATRRTFGKSVPRSCMYLSYVRAPYRLTRESTHAFRMELGKDAVMLLTALEHMLRAPDRPLRLHETVDVGHFRATILELANGLPKRVRFAFDRPLDDPSLLLMVPEARGFRRFELPAIGTSTLVPAPAMPVFVPGS
jgi:hypothetical protein